MVSLVQVVVLLLLGTTGFLQFASADQPWIYGVNLNPTFQYVPLASDPLAEDISCLLGNDNDVALNASAAIAFEFFGVNIAATSWVLNANGYISFNGSTSMNWVPPCPFPDSAPAANSFQLGFAFYFTDLSPLLGGSARYRFYPVGQCPYTGKSSDGCLVVDMQGTLMDDGSPAGNLNALVFTSGDMLGQIELSASGEWGQANETLGVGFGIQDTNIPSGFMYPNTTCGWVDNPGFADAFVPQGAQFSFMFTAPCGQIGNLTVARQDGLGCGCNSGFYVKNIYCFPCPNGQSSNGVTCGAKTLTTSSTAASSATRVLSPRWVNWLSTVF